MNRRLLCTDLDRTLIPNGTQRESTRARELFERLVNRSEVTLVYVTGRHRELIEEAICKFDLPLPAYAIGDVGASIYEVTHEGWHLLPDWQSQLQECWSESQVEELKKRLQQLSALRLQEPSKLRQFKVSFYANVDARFQQLMSDVENYAAQCNLSANLIWSHDQETGDGLLDILPKRANKLTAIRYLMDRLKFEVQDTLFAGDSGNDMQVFRSMIPSVIVANAEEDIKQCAMRDNASPIYVASGALDGLNGNYCSGIVEGACHFWPEVREWIKDN